MTPAFGFATTRPGLPEHFKGQDPAVIAKRSRTTNFLDPGKTYQVQFKDDLNRADWQDMPETIIATSSTGTFLDPASSPKRFYRVQLLSIPSR